MRTARSQNLRTTAKTKRQLRMANQKRSKRRRNTMARLQNGKVLNFRRRGVLPPAEEDVAARRKRGNLNKQSPRGRRTGLPDHKLGSSQELAVCFWCVCVLLVMTSRTTTKLPAIF